MTDQVFADPGSFVALPRLTGLALSPDGARLVASLQRPDAKGARYASEIWDLGLDGSAPRRLTRSDKGETSPAFLPDGSLLFVSAREAPDGSDGDDDDAQLWLLPSAGEPYVIARSPGGVGGPAVAADAGTIVLSGSRLVGSADAATDAAHRKDRKDRKVTAILHTGMPIRYWDHELGDVSPRLLHLASSAASAVPASAASAAPSAELRDLAPDAGFALTEATYSISADGRTVATTWREPRRGGSTPFGLVVLDVDTGKRTVLAGGAGEEYVAPVISPDAERVAVIRQTDGDFDTPLGCELRIYRTDGAAEPVRAQLGELFPTGCVWSRDGRTLFVTGDWHGRAPVLAVDPGTGAVIRRLASDAAYSDLCPAPDGRHVFALRSAIDDAPSPVRLDVSRTDQQPVRLATPAPTPPLPGTLTEVQLPLPGGGTHRGWLCLPAQNDGPAPLMLWVHGGPFMSYNSWSWRWNPWVAVARGYAVLLPDPALSTGYGADWIARGWPHRAGVVWSDLEALLEHVLESNDVDATRTACLGGSFGGFMTNWIAGHTDRFGAIVTHAGLWALDQQHTTTDGAAWKSGLFGTPADHPQWYAENSPHNFVDAIRTPMLIVHGNRDYRVPVSEALRLWWDLVSRFDGDPDELPHRFLQLTGENHWVLSPANAQIWYDTVLGFCDQHVRGG